MDWKTSTELLNVLAWPLVVAIVLLAFRKPLAAFLEGLGGRVTKLSVFEVSVELATLSAPPSPWSDPRIPQYSEMTGGEVSSTALMTLFERIGVTTPWDYLIIDIKDGHFWLISRVFIFTVFLQAMRGVQCVVFVESRGEHHYRLVGLASPDAVRAALSRAHPWLEQALANAMNKHHTYRLNQSLDPGVAGQIIRSFIEDPEMRKTTQPSPLDDWTKLPAPSGTSPIWEHTYWLTLEQMDKDLRRSFYEYDISRYDDLLDTPTEERTKELLRRKAPFIALVNSKGEFQRLLDRQTLLEQIVQTV